MTCARVTRDEWSVQGCYGDGWEEVTAEETRPAALERLREYRENEGAYTGTPFRLRKVRVRIADEVTP